MFLSRISAETNLKMDYFGSQIYPSLLLGNCETISIPQQQYVVIVTRLIQSYKH